MSVLWWSSLRVVADLNYDRSNGPFCDIISLRMGVIKHSVLVRRDFPRLGKDIDYLGHL